MRGAAAFTAVVAAAVLLASRAIAAAPPAGIVSEDVPVRGGTAALARAIGVDPALDRARFVAEVARLVYADTKLKRREPQSAFRRLRAYLEGDRSRTGSHVDLVPMPLTAAVWSDAVFHREIAPTDLFATIIADPSAALLARGLAALDDETLRFLIDHPATIARLYDRDAAVFAAFAGHLRIHGDAS